MSTYQFAGSLYRTKSDMLDAIAHDWITSMGSATLEDLRDILLAASDGGLAVECITELGLNEPSDPDDPESLAHMEGYGYEVSDLAAAFAGFRFDIEHDLDVLAAGDGEMHEPW